MLLNVSHLNKSFGDVDVLSDITFDIDKGEHLAVVGRNGSGKSTLFSIITGAQEHDGGNISISKDVQIGFLHQYVDQVLEGTIFDYVLHAREDILAMEKELHEMEEKMSIVSHDEIPALMEKYESTSHIFDSMGGNSYRSEVNGTLFGLGFTEDDFSRDAKTLSGGQKTRLSLARILMSSSDLLILDEPTNHLDISSIEWLEGFLQKYKGAIMIACHDRYFLDKVCDHVLNLSERHAHLYAGNYTAFVKQRENDLITLHRQVEKQQKEIAHQEEVIKKLQQFNREKSIKRAESRKKVLDKTEIIEDEKDSEAIMRPKFRFELQSGNDVLSVSGLEKSYDGETLYSDISFEIKRGEKVAIIGDNGTGKTTILKQLLGDVSKPQEAHVRFGVNVNIGYYDQAQQRLDSTKTIFEEIHDTYPKMTEGEVRKALAGFLFKNDEIEKKIESLSGGERARVAFTKLSLADSNFLILDEPTNHLDMESKEALEKALTEYEGTILFVSHDRYFVNRVASVIYELYHGHFVKYDGNYDYYVEKRDSLRKLTESDNGLIDDTADAAAAKGSENVSDAKLDYAEQKRQKAEKERHDKKVKALEDKIAELEGKVSEIDGDFLKPENQKNSKKLNDLMAEQNKLKEELEQLYSDWEVLSEE